LKKSVTRTVRLDEDLDNGIQRRASESNISVNFLVNQLIRKYIEWDIPAGKFGAVFVSATVLRRLTEGIDDKTAGEIGRLNSREFFSPFCRYLFGEITYDTSILTFKRMAEYTNTYTMEATSDSRNHVIILRHDGGHKISSFYEGFLKGIYSEILKMETRIESTDEYCIAQIKIA
jgi:hypothetical protein